MARSMTGYGRCRKTISGMDITVEIKSVNHRYYEFSSRTPRVYGFLDDKLKDFVRSFVSRGKVDIYVWIENIETSSSKLSINYELADKYHRALIDVSDRYDIPTGLNASLFTRFPDVLVVQSEDEDEDRIWDAVRDVAAEAVGNFVEMRSLEGARLKDDILLKLSDIGGMVAEIEYMSPQIVAAYLEKMKNKMSELLENTAIDEQRLLTEAAIFADKTAVDEETVRLRSHLKQFVDMLELSEPIGRKLDFLMQEMNRETNTIGSKSQDVTVSRIIVDMKAELEKIREQVQNIE